MTPTAALDALVAAVEMLCAEDTTTWMLPDVDLTSAELGLRSTLAQAQAVLAQREEHAPPATDPIERLKAALKPAPPDRTTWPTRDVLSDALYTWNVASRSFGGEKTFDEQADAILALFPTPEALTKRIVTALRDELERPSDLRIITWTWLEALILRAIQETPR